jgi:hypothetical protein
VEPAAGHLGRHSLRKPRSIPTCASFALYLGLEAYCADMTDWERLRSPPRRQPRPGEFGLRSRPAGGALPALRAGASGSSPHSAPGASLPRSESAAGRRRLKSSIDRIPCLLRRLLGHVEPVVPCRRPARFLRSSNVRRTLTVDPAAATAEPRAIVRRSQRARQPTPQPPPRHNRDRLAGERMPGCLPGPGAQTDGNQGGKELALKFDSTRGMDETGWELIPA